MKSAKTLDLNVMNKSNYLDDIYNPLTTSIISNKRKYFYKLDWDFLVIYYIIKILNQVFLLLIH